jgi:hypothetical protein
LLVNEEFYNFAANIFCQSEKHALVIKQNLNTDNIVNLGCSVWSEENIVSLQKAINNKKNNKAAVLDSSNEIKGTPRAISFCEKKNISYDLISAEAFDNFIQKLSTYEKLVFFPKVLESFSRLAVEAKILNCKILTNNNLGCTSEKWFLKYSGQELLDFVIKKQKKVLHTIESSIFQEETVSENNSITVILNSYRRPYNLEMQVKAIREQTKKPCEIWLWVNHHEDNVGYDYNKLDIDKVFHNDYNWKFYGRFAAALKIVY